MPEVEDTSKVNRVAQSITGVARFLCRADSLLPNNAMESLEVAEAHDAIEVEQEQPTFKNQSFHSNPLPSLRSSACEGLYKMLRRKLV